MLTEPEVARFLTSLGLLEPASVLEDGFRIQNVSRRNLGLKILTRAGPCYFVKQGIGAGGESTVGCEAAIYRFLGSAPEAKPLLEYLPRFVAYDEPRCILVLELARDSRSLAEHFALMGTVPRGAAEAQGKALAATHQVPPPRDIGRQGSPRHDSARPWVLSIHRPGSALLRESSSATVELVRIVQSFSGFRSLLDQLHEEWSADTLVHFDLKSDNCILLGRSTAARPKRGSFQLKIVDWELARAGDPAWDVGSVFGDYLSLWLMTLPLMSDSPPERFLQLTRFPLDRMVPAIRTFCRSYMRSRLLQPDEAQDQLERAVRFAAARVLQAAVEHSQTHTRPTGNAICMLQLSWNMLRGPREAAEHLLGLPSGPGIEA